MMNYSDGSTISHSALQDCGQPYKNHSKDNQQGNLGYNRTEKLFLHKTSNMFNIFC
jgi:hypothetical protein